MNTLQGILLTIIPVILMIAIGMLCRRFKILEKPGIDGLKALIIHVCLPAVLISAFYQTRFDWDIVIITISMFALCLLALGLGLAGMKLFRIEGRTAAFLTSGFEAGMLGYALYALLLGTANLTPFAMVDLGQVLFVFTVYVTLLQKNEGGSVKGAWRAMVKSPIILAIALGVLLGATGLGRQIGQSAAGAIVQTALDFIKAPTAAVILLVVGYEINFDLKNIRLSMTMIGWRVLIIGALGAVLLWGIRYILPVPADLKWAFVLMFLLPPPFVLPVYVQSETEGAFISTAISLYTILSLIAFAGLSIVIKTGAV